MTHAINQHDMFSMFETMAPAGAMLSASA